MDMQIRLDLRYVLITILILVGAYGAYHFRTVLKGKDQVISKLEADLATSQNRLEYKPINYFGCTDGVCDIPRASGVPFDAKCTWTYSAGNGAIPYIEQTDGTTLYGAADSPFDLRVLCLDERGQVYFGEK